MNNANVPVFNEDIARQIRSLMQTIDHELDGPNVPIVFEEPRAEPGAIPRLMLAPRANEEDAPRYISGEAVHLFSFSLYLRQHPEESLTSFDAPHYLTNLVREFLKRSVSIDGYIAYRKPIASPPIKSQSTSEFEDWCVTVHLVYKQTLKKG